MSNRRRIGRPVVLVVLDGWGFRRETEGNAIALGHTPTWDALWAGYPATLLEASGTRVGLPEGQMGNSEVGHLNIGAGRVVAQDIGRISQAVGDGSFFEQPALVHLCAHAREGGGTLHILGLLGDGGVHAHDEHLRAAIELGRRHGVTRIAIHPFLDGRDTPPQSALDFMRALAAFVETVDTPVSIATVVGRYFAMDRDRRWPRTKLAYDALVHGTGETADDACAAVRSAYDRGETDEFVKPIVIRDTPRIGAGDAIFAFNFRADRMRQIIRALSEADFAEFETGQQPDVSIATMTQYDERFTVPYVFAPRVLSHIMAETLADRDMTQFRTAETEKYPHVTYFFNGGFETPYAGEERILVPSPQVATYDLQPEMSAPGVTDVLCKAIEAKHHEFILCNYANADMVGHTGSLEAAIKAVETVDACLARVLGAAERANAALAVTADHGNCEVMIDPTTGEPHTAHTTNLVPFVVFNGHVTAMRSGGALCDIAPTVLRMIGEEPPDDMTGSDLREGC